MIYFGLIIFAIYLVFKFLYIFFPLKSRKQFEFDKDSTALKSFAILIPAYNEKDVIINCVDSLTELQYLNHNMCISSMTVQPMRHLKFSKTIFVSFL